MSYELLKSLHIIFVVTWFAGLFYIVRLFIYHVEALERPSEEQKILVPQLSLMQKRLWYGITWPSAVLTLIFGPSLLQFYWPVTEHPWILVKLIFVFLLFLYHLFCGHIFKKLQKNIVFFGGQQLRYWNEVATLFLFALVFLAVYKQIESLGIGLVGLLILTMVLVLAIRLYKKIRK